MKLSNDNAASIPQQSLMESILYHLLPGLGILMFYVLACPLVIKMGFDSSFAVVLGFVVVGIPIRLFILLKEGFRVNKRFSIKNVVFYTRGLPFWQYIVLSVIFIFYAAIVSSVLAPFNSTIQVNLFFWLPDWFTANSASLSRNSPLFIIIISFSAKFLVDGLINPIVEEIYFRGFLLPRISRYGIWSPFMNAALFSLAHYWQPWNMLQIFILVAPVYYLVWRKQNIYISIVVHCLANLIGIVLTLGQYLSS